MPCGVIDLRQWAENFEIPYEFRYSNNVFRLASYPEMLGILLNGLERFHIIVRCSLTFRHKNFIYLVQNLICNVVHFSARIRKSSQIAKRDGSKLRVVSTTVGVIFQATLTSRHIITHISVLSWSTLRDISWYEYIAVWGKKWLLSFVLVRRKFLPPYMKKRPTMRWDQKVHTTWLIVKPHGNITTDGKETYKQDERVWYMSTVLCEWRCYSYNS